MIVECSGFVDLQVNGFGGMDFNAADLTGEQVRRAVAALRATGVTRLLPTLITSPVERFARCARAVLEVDDPAIAGIHMEGPYISPADGARGAHLAAYTRAASIDDFARRQEAARGRIVLVTMAPEVPGALQLIEHLASTGVRAAIGHTQASPDVIRDAILAGATMSTHLGNGCAPVLPRHPNVIWEQLAADELRASVIVDGHHLPPATVKSIVRAKSPERVILITDATAAAGGGPGAYRLGDADVDVTSDRRVVLRGTASLAGSTLTIPEAIARTVAFTGLPLRQVLAMASTQPAEYLGIEAAGTVTGEFDPVLNRFEVREVRGGE
jgi:N-acetylglucosamine-6-phosphate deacetylase